MRQPLHVLRYFVILLALCFTARAYADDRAEARTHYQAAVKYYSGADYRSAIREFSAAQQLVPADLNNYNLALCYDKLGDAEPAIQYYRAFLDKQPNSEKRAEIEASINRLDAASRSAASKRAKPEPKLDPKPEPKLEPKPDDAARPVGPVLGPVPGPSAGPDAAPVGPTLGPAAGPTLGPVPPPTAATEPRKPPKRGPAVAGSIGTPSSGMPASTGDAQLDRVNAMNIDEIRQQRMGGVPAEGGGPAAARPSVAQGQPGQPGSSQAGSTGPNGPNGPTGMTAPVAGGSPDEPKKEAPVYKKWWFWAVVAVGAYVVYELATTSSQSQNTVARELPLNGRVAPPPPSGLTLLRW